MKDWMMPLTIGLVALVAIGLGATVSQGMISNNPFEAKDLFERGMRRPYIWVFYDTSIPNARKYACNKSLNIWLLF
jgi:hypothetical protein